MKALIWLCFLILSLLVSSADNLCKQLRPRSDKTSGLIWIPTVSHSDSVLGKNSFKKVYFEKYQQTAKIVKNYPICEELNIPAVTTIMSCFHSGTPWVLCWSIQSVAIFRFLLTNSCRLSLSGLYLQEKISLKLQWYCIQTFCNVESARAFKFEKKHIQHILCTISLAISYVSHLFCAHLCAVPINFYCNDENRILGKWNHKISDAIL